MTTTAEDDANGLYMFCSKPKVPRSETPDVRIKFVALHKEKHHIKEEQILFNSHTNLHRVRKKIRNYFENCFQKDFIFLRNQQEIRKSKETTTELWQILPVVPRCLAENSKKILKKRHDFQNAECKTISVHCPVLGYSHRRMCVLMVFLYEKNGSTTWQQNELRNQLNGISLKSFTYYPSTLMSANYYITESNIEEINRCTVTGDIDQIKNLLKHSKDHLRSLIDYRGATPLHYAARHGHLHLCEYFMVEYDSELCIKDTLDMNNQNPLNYLLTFLDVLVTDIDKRTSPQSIPTSLYNTKDIKHSKKNKNDVKLNDNPNAVIKKLKQERDIPIVIQHRLDVVAYLLTQKPDLYTKDSSGYSCVDRICNLSQTYKTYLIRRIDPCFIDKGLVWHFAEFALQYNLPVNSISRMTLMEYVEELSKLDELPKLCGIFPPLHLAELNNDDEIIRVLLKNGHHQSKKDTNGLLPFHYACYKGHQSVIMLLCFDEMKNADILTGIKWYFQTCVCKRKDFGDVFAKLLQMRPALIDEMVPDFQMTVISCMEQNISAIHWIKLFPLIDLKRQHRFLSQAAYVGSYESIEYLLNAGVNVNVKDFMGRTALHEAMFSGHSDIVNLLLSAGADPNSVDNRHSSPLHYACIAADAYSESLLSSRCPYGFFNSEQMSKRIISCMEVLTRPGRYQLDYNIPDICGRTPLLNAIHYKRLDIFTWLLQNHFDKLNIFIHDISGHSILHYLPFFTTEVLDFIFLKLNDLKTLTSNDSNIPIWRFDLQSDVKTSSYWNILPGTKVQSNTNIEPKDGAKLKKRFRLQTKTFHNRDLFSRYEAPQPLLPHIVMALSSKQDHLLQMLLESCPLLAQDRRQLVMAGLVAAKLWNLEIFEILYTYGNYSFEDMASFLYHTVANIPLKYQQISPSKICASLVSEEHEGKQLNLLKFLIDHRASTNFLVDTGNGKQTVLEVAVISTNIKIVKILLEHATVYGCFSALLAALNGNKEMLQLLLGRAKTEMTEDHVLHIISPEITKMRSSKLMLHGLVKAACCSTNSKLSILMCISDYFPGILSEKGILTQSMITKIRDDKILLKNGFLFEPQSPISSLMIANKDSKLCAEITGFMLKAGLYMQGVEVIQENDKMIHMACDSFCVAFNLKRWDCLIQILESSGDVIWKCLLFESDACMHCWDWEAEHIKFLFNSSRLDSEKDVKHFKNVINYYMYKILHSNIDVVVAFVHSGRTFLSQLSREKQDEIRNYRHISVSDTYKSVNDVFFELLKTSMIFFKLFNGKDDHFDKALVTLKLSFALTEWPHMEYYRRIRVPTSYVKHTKINTSSYIASDNMDILSDSIKAYLPPPGLGSKGVSMALSWFNNENENVNATASKTHHQPQSEIPLVNDNADMFDEVPWYIEPFITRPYKDNTSTNKWKVQKLYVRNIRNCRNKSSNVQMIMTQKNRDTEYHKSLIKTFKSKNTSLQMKSLMTIPPQADYMENIEDNYVIKRPPRFLPEHKLLTTHTLLTQKKFALHKLKYKRLVPKIINTVPRIGSKGVSMALSWFNNENENVNATASKTHHQPQSEIPLVNGNADMFDEVPWYIEPSITRPYKDNTSTNKWKAFSDSTDIANVLGVRQFKNQKLYVRNIRNCRNKSSNVQMIMTQKNRDTEYHKSLIKTFKSKNTSLQMKSLMTIPPQADYMENIEDNYVIKRPPRFLPEHKLLTTHTLLTQKKFALHKLKYKRLVPKIINTVPRIYCKRNLYTYPSPMFDRYSNLQCQSLHRADYMPFLHMASAAGDLELLEHYFKSESLTNINEEWNGLTPIDLAASQLQTESVQFLLDKGAKLTEHILFQTFNASFKGFVLWNGHQLISDDELESRKMDMAEFLIKRHCRVEYECIYEAISKELWKLTDFLLDHYREPDLQRWCDLLLYLMRNPEDHLCDKILKIIINKSSEITPDMITHLLNFSTKRRSSFVLELIMTQLVFPLYNYQKDHLHTNLHTTVCGGVILEYLSIRGMTSVIKSILSLVTNQDDYLNDKNNALHKALLNGHFETAELLLLNGFQLYKYRNIKSAHFLGRLLNEQRQLRDRVVHLLMLERNAYANKTSILHSAAAFGDFQTLVKIREQPFVDVMTSAKYPNLYSVAACNHQNETFEMCLNTKQYSGGVPDNMEAVVKSFLSTLIPKPETFKYRQKQLNNTEADALYTFIKGQFYGNPGYHEHRTLTNTNTIRFLQMMDVNVNDDIMVLFALIGKPWIIDVLQKWCTVDTIKECLRKKLFKQFSFLDIYLLCTVSSSDVNNKVERETFLRKLLSLQNDIEISNLSLHSLYLDGLTSFAGIILNVLQSPQRNLDMSGGWINLLYRAISKNDITFVKSFCTKGVELKTLLIGVCISLLKNKSEIASYLLGFENIDILKHVKLPSHNRTTTILECIGKVKDNNHARSIIETLLDNKPTIKNKLKDVACQYICRSGSVSFLETMSNILGNITVTFDDLLIAVTAANEELAVALIQTDRYLTFNTLQFEILIRIVQIACRYNLKQFVEALIKKLQYSDVQKILAGADKNDFNTLDITKLMGHIDLYFTLKSYCQLTLENYTDDEIFIGWFRYLMKTNDSHTDNFLKNIDVNVNYDTWSMSLSNQVSNVLRFFIYCGDDNASSALLQTGQEMILLKMKSAYSKYPYIHLLTYCNCAKSLRTLIDLCDEDNTRDLISWLEYPWHLSSVRQAYTDCLTIAIERKSLECFKILWNIDSNRAQVTHVGDTLLHLAVQSEITDIIEIVNTSRGVHARSVTNKLGYTPAMIAASMGRHDLISSLVKDLDLTDVIPDNHSSHDITEHTCLGCLLDLCIGWSKIYQRRIHNPQESTVILRSFTNDITKNGFITTSSIIHLSQKWTKSAFSRLAQIVELHDNSFENLLSSCIFYTKGYGSCSVEEARLSGYRNINKVIIARHGMTDIALQVTEHDHANDYTLLTDVLMNCVQLGNLKTIQSILDRELLKTAQFSKINYKSLCISAVALGRLDIASYLFNEMDKDGKIFVLAELEKIKEALPLITLMFCGFRNPGDQQWCDNYYSTDRFTDSDTLHIIPKKTPFIVDIESRALLETILPNTWLGKTLNIHIDQFVKRSTGWSYMMLMNMLVVCVLKRYASLFSVESPAWGDIDQIIIKCLDEGKDDVPSLQVNNRSIIDTVQLKDDLSGQSTYFVTSDIVPFEISVEQNHVQRLQDIVIPDIENQIKDDLGIEVNITFDWPTILTHDSNGDRAILKAMDHGPYLQLGGLHEAVRTCSTMVSTMIDWYNPDMVENVIHLLAPVKEIQVRYVSVLPELEKHDFSKIGPVVYWYFTIREDHVHFNIECFPIYEIIRTCFVGYQNLYGLAVELQNFTDDLSIKTKKHNTPKVFLNIDWTSFGYLGSKIKKYFANGVHYELQRVVATRSWNSHIPMSINIITLGNAHRNNVGISYSNSDQTLHIQVKQDDSDTQLKVEALNLDEAFTVLERQQILTPDIFDLFGNIKKINDEEMATSTNIARLNVSQPALDDIIVKTRVAGMYHLVNTNDRLCLWFDKHFQRHNTKVLNYLTSILESSFCVYLGNYDVTFGIWTEVTDAEVKHSIENNKETYQMYLGYSIELATFYLLNTVDDIKPTPCMFWKWQPCGSILGTDGSMKLISINKKLYLAVDYVSVQAILVYLPKFSYPLTETPFATEKLMFMFMSQGFYSKDTIHENDLLKLFTLPEKTVLSSTMWIFKLWKLCLKMGIRLHIDVESIRQVCASSTDVTLGLVVRVVREFIFSLNNQSRSVLKNLKVITLGGIIDASQNTKVISPYSVYIQVYSYDNADEITNSLKRDFACLGAQHLTEELVACFASNTMPVEVSIKDLEDPIDFDIYVENMLVLLDVVSAVIRYIVNNYKDPKLIILKKSSTILVDPNPGFEILPMFVYNQNVLHVTVPRYVITKTIYCIDSILTKHDQPLSDSPEIMFEPLESENKVLVNKGIFWIKYRNIAGVKLDQENIKQQLQQQLKVVAFKSNRSDATNVIAVKTNVIDDETLEVQIPYKRNINFLQIELSTYKHRHPKPIHNIKWYNRGKFISRQSLVTGNLLIFCVRPTCDCHNSSRVYRVYHNKIAPGLSDQKLFHRYVSDIKLSCGQNIDWLATISAIQAASKYKVFSMTSPQIPSCRIRAECMFCGQACKFPVWSDLTDKLSVEFNIT